MGFFNWKTNLIIALLTASIVFYIINYLIFKDPSFMLRLTTLQLAFIPISVILITFIINGMLTRREKLNRLRKLNMIVGVFFSEVGRELLRFFTDFDPGRKNISRALIVATDWTGRDFEQARTHARHYNYTIEIDKEKLRDLRSYLTGKREFLLRLLENPSLLEYESFTEFLRAIFHLTEELGFRTDVTRLPAADYAHLANDTKRAYGLLVSEWIAYLHYLKNNYPYFYSLSVRTNPLNPDASPEVKE